MIFSNIVNRTLSSAIARSPSIRFRYGASRDQKATTTATSAVPPASTSQAAPSQPGEAIYDFQIPPRWKRRPMSDEEIAYVNRGGPE